MKSYKITVLGSGNAGLTFAGDFSLAGHTVNICELPQFKASLDPIRKAGCIEMRGAARNGYAKLNMITTDIEEALHGAEVIVVAVPAYGHIAFAKALAPYVEEGQIITLNPSYTLGSIEFANTLKDKGVDLDKILLGSTGISPYATRKFVGNKVFCRVVKVNIPFSAFPAKNTGKMLSILNEFYPQEDGNRGILIDSVNDLKLSLENVNLYVHPPMMILKAVYCELGEGPFVKADKSRAVRLLSKAMNREAMAITASFGMKPWSHEYLYTVLMYPSWTRLPGQVDRPQWAKPENQPVEYAAGRGFNFLKGRYITEDLPYGLVAISELGELVKVPTPSIDAIIEIGSTITETDFRKTGRTLKKLGVAGMSKNELVTYVNER